MAKRVLCLILALLTAVSLCVPALGAEDLDGTVDTEDVVDGSTPEPEPTVEPDEGSEPEPTAGPDEGGKVPDGGQPEGGSNAADGGETGEDLPEEPSGEDSLPDADASQEEEPPYAGGPEASAEELAAEEAEPVYSTYELTLRYDDRYSFSEHPQLSGYSITEIITDSVTSRQVSQGSVTSRSDTAAVMKNGNSVTDIIACGVGTATVILAPSDGSQEPAKVTVTVEPAPLTVLFIAGQSNAEGLCDGSGYHPENSVLCPEGQVYSTYAPAGASYAKNLTGISSFTACTQSNASSFVAGSLTGTKSLSGGELVYPLNALTAKGRGKAGMDSALAYRWNQLTGEKVWVVNVAWSGTRISGWQPRGGQYERALTVYQDVLKTVSAEVSAGHYTPGHRLLFWLQGEYDTELDAEGYVSGFRAMQRGFDQAVSANYQIEYYGIVMVRSSTGSYLNADELYMTGPRIAQYYLGNSQDDPKVYVVSNANEQWVSNAGVASYFRAAYPSGSYTYPLRANTTLKSLPTTVAGVHGTIHYSQAGHNENGLTAAETMYQIVTGSQSGSSLSVSWRDLTGAQISSVEAVQNIPYVAIPVVTPLSRSKAVTYSVSTSGLSYAAARGEIRSIDDGGGSLIASDLSGGMISELPVIPTQLHAPTLTNISGGIKVTWDRLTVKSYYLYRQVGNGAWVQIATLSGSTTSYTDSAVSNGKTYSYKLCVAANDGQQSGYSDARSITFNAMPQISSVANTTSGVKITWAKVAGAAKYRVFYKTASGWTRIADTASTSYTWTGAKAGTTYTFTVRCISSDGKSYTSAYDTIGKSITYYPCATPKLSAVANVADGVKITWGKVSGAAKYRVFYKTGNGSWTKIADTTSTSYTWTKAKSGTTYTFTVRCINASASAYTSAYGTTGMSITYVAAPKLSAVTNVADGVTITWGKVAGAEKYRVFYKTGSGSWTAITDTADTSCTWTGAKNNTKYTFTVRCISGDGTAYTSGYNGTGKSITYLSAPKISALSNTATGVKITWGKVTGAAKYRVFYKTASGWTKIADTAATSYTWTGAKNNTAYTFTVRCISSNGKSYTSGYDGAGKSITYLAAPNLSAVSNAASGVTITWGKVAGAEKYRVFYKTGSGSWTEIEDTTATSYTWTGAKNNTKYTFTVRCVNSDGTAYTSGYNGTGKSVTYLTPPAVSVSNVSNGIKVSWNKVSGAAKYRVYYKVGDTGSWTKIGDTASTAYTFTRAASGKTYYFTVRCVNASGALTSYYIPSAAILAE